MIKTHRRAAWVATLTLALGIVTSLGGNLQAINLGGREPGVGAYISAVFWPLALFAAIEVMLHTPWLASRRDNLTKWVGLASVAGMAAYVSYGHMVHVLLAYGYDKPSWPFRAAGRGRPDGHVHPGPEPGWPGAPGARPGGHAGPGRGGHAASRCGGQPG
jgi:hypothetical protein